MNLMMVMKISRRPGSAVMGLALLLAANASAHVCGPQRIDIKVGKTCLWRVYADMSETLSFYQPVLVGSPSVADVHPKQNFYAHHGDFLITGHSPGTNYLNVVWSYQPTGAAGPCTVMIVVTEDDGTPDLETLNTSGFLSTSGGAAQISSSDLFFQIDRYIPREAPKLLIFAQCFGGNMALHSLIRNMPNTTILSATTPNQEAHYGGYHDDAARGLKPEAGRTASTVHEEASIGKSTIIPKDPSDTSPDPVDPTQLKELFHKYAELPRISGTVPPEQFSLEPVTSTGAVRSRHIVIYAGRPDSKTEFVLRHGTHTIPTSPPVGTKERFSDAADRDQIRQNFPADATTTVSAVGGEKGDAGWDHPGTLDGLHKAIKEAGAAIEAAADPSKEQFILFVTDHGEIGAELFPAPQQVPANQRRNLRAAAGSGTRVGTDLQPLAPDDPAIDSMIRSSRNQPGLRLRFAAPGGAVPNLAPGNLSLELSNSGGVVTLNQFSAEGVDLDGDGVIGSDPAEGVLAFFPVEETLLLDLLAQGPFSIDLVNNTGQSLEITEAMLLSGAISMGNSRAPPFITAIFPLENGEIEVRVNGLDGERHVLETSLNLQTWAAAGEQTFQGPGGVFHLTPGVAEPGVFMRVVRP